MRRQAVMLIFWIALALRTRTADSILDSIFPSINHRYVKEVASQHRVSVKQSQRKFSWTQTESEYCESSDGYEYKPPFRSAPSTGCQRVSSSSKISSAAAANDPASLDGPAIVYDYTYNIAENYLTEPLEEQFELPDIHLKLNIVPDNMRPKPITVAFAHIDGSVFKSSSGSLFKIVPVIVTGPKHKINVFALLDDGTSDTLIDKEVADFIGAKGPSDTISVNGVVGMSKISKVNLVDFDIRGLFCNETFNLIKVSAIPNLDTIRQVVHVDDLIKFPYLQDIAREMSYREAIPSLIIGIDNYHLLLPRELRRGFKNEPAAIRTALGWTVFGKVSARSVETISSDSPDPRIYAVP